MSINAQLALPGIPAGDVIPNATIFDAWEDSGYYFRIAGSDADILNETSVELPASAGSPDEIAQIMGYPDFDALNQALEDPFADMDTLWWNDEGHLGPGLYYAGVCCTTSLGETLRYCRQSGIRRETARRSGLALFVISGKWIGDCRDGDVIEPERVIATMPLHYLLEDNNVS